MVSMFDSVDVGEIPAWAPVVAGYIDGAWPTYTALPAKFRDRPLLPITTGTSPNARCIDVEKGNATPRLAAQWARRKLNLGYPTPWIYANRSTMWRVRLALALAGVKRADVVLWVADWTGRPHLPRGYDACQWTNRALGRNLDQSLVQRAALAQNVAASKTAR